MFCIKQRKLKLLPILVIVCILLSACGKSLTPDEIETLCKSYEDAIQEEIGLDDSTGLMHLGINHDDYPKLGIVIGLEEPIQPDDFLEKARDITSSVKSVMDDSSCTVKTLMICLYNSDELAKYWDTKDFETGTFLDFNDLSESGERTNVTLDELISEQEDSNR